MSFESLESFMAVCALRQHVHWPVPQLKHFYDIQRVPALRAFWDLEKTVLHEICVSGTAGGPILTQKSPTCMYISQKPW